MNDHCMYTLAYSKKTHKKKILGLFGDYFLKQFYVFQNKKTRLATRK